MVDIQCSHIEWQKLLLLLLFGLFFGRLLFLIK